MGGKGVIKVTNRLSLPETEGFFGTGNIQCYNTLVIIGGVEVQWAKFRNKKLNQKANVLVVLESGFRNSNHWLFNHWFDLWSKNHSHLSVRSSQNNLSSKTQ